MAILNSFTELENYLINMGVDRSAIAINETPQDGQYAIQFDGSKTEVFLPERGIKHELRTFGSKTEAMKYFVDIVLSDPRNKPGSN